MHYSGFEENLSDLEEILPGKTYFEERYSRNVKFSIQQLKRLIKRFEEFFHTDSEKTCENDFLKPMLQRLVWYMKKLIII